MKPPIGDGAQGVDPEYGANVFITGFHAAIHAGIAYTAAYVVPDAGPLIANDVTLNILIRTNATHEPHMQFHRDMTGDADVELFKAPTNNLLGTPFLAENMKDGGASANTLFYLQTPASITDPGTLWFPEYQAGGTGGQASGVEGRFREREMALSKDYLYRITNRSGQDRRIGLFALFYEIKEA